jgi:hypothetical protein
MVTTAVSSVKVAVADSSEVGRSAMYNGRRTLLWGGGGTLALGEDSYVYSVSTFTRKCLLCK